MKGPLPLLCVPLVLCFVGCLLAGIPDGPAQEGRQVDELIRQLGDESFDKREEATRLLMRREDAERALRDATKSRDPEVARRATQVLDWFARREQERDFARLTSFAKSGAVDQVVEILVRHEKWDDEIACWQVVAALAGRLSDLEKEVYGKASLPDHENIPARDFRRYVAAVKPSVRFFSGRSPSRRQLGTHVAARAEAILTASTLGQSFCAASGDIRVLLAFDSVILSGDSVRVECGAHNSLIVCDGDLIVESDGRLGNCLVVAGGEVRCNDIRNCHIITGKNVRYDKGAKVSETMVRENEPKPLGFIMFFDPAKVGIKVETVDGGVKVKTADKGKNFGRAGLLPDDVLTAINGERVKDAETFRRKLRARLAEGAELVLQVRRDDKPLEVRVPPIRD